MIAAKLCFEKFQDAVSTEATGEIVNYHQPFSVCPRLGEHHLFQRKVGCEGGFPTETMISMKAGDGCGS